MVTNIPEIKTELRYSIDRKVTNSAVQEVVASLAYYTRNKGIVVTNSFFTQSAKELAKVNNVELWDRNDVINFLNTSNLQSDLI